MPERTDNLDRAQERLDQAEADFAEAKSDFNAAAVEDAVVWTHNLEGLVARVRDSVSRVREQPSLDHSATRRDVLKELDAMRRHVAALREKIKTLGEPQ